MTIRKILGIVAATLLIGCSVATSQRAQEQDSGFREIKSGGASLVYNAADFDEVKIEREKKLTAKDVGDDVPFGIAPEHDCFYLKDKRSLPALEKGARYFQPAQSFICAIPLKDTSVKDFAGAYPNLNSARQDLQRILRQRPAKLPNSKGIPDIPYNNASPIILSRFQYLDFRSGSGILFLTQYSQEMEPNPVNNEELTLNFHGLTKDARYYIAGRLAITHPSLPKGIDFTGNIERDKGHVYLKNAEKSLEGLPEASFQPSLKSLKALLASISIE